MADRYLDSTYVEAHLGTAYVDAATGTPGVDIDVMIEAATALVKSALKNSGYTPPSTQDPDEVDELIKLAVLGCFREMLASIPEAQIPLPDGWQASPQKLALKMIIDGDFPVPSEDPDHTGAIGGSTVTDPTLDTNYSRKTTKTQLAGY